MLLHITFATLSISLFQHDLMHKCATLNDQLQHWNNSEIFGAGRECFKEHQTHATQPLSKTAFLRNAHTQMTIGESWPEKHYAGFLNFHLISCSDSVLRRLQYSIAIVALPPWTLALGSNCFTFALLLAKLLMRLPVRVEIILASLCCMSCVEMHIFLKRKCRILAWLTTALRPFECIENVWKAIGSCCLEFLHWVRATNCQWQWWCWWRR